MTRHRFHGDPTRFEILAEYIAQRYGHTTLDVEHMTLAMLEQDDGMARKVVEHCVGDAAVVSQLKKSIERELASTPSVEHHGGGQAQVYVSPPMRRVMDLAGEESSRLGDTFIGVEQLAQCIFAFS